MAYLEGESPDLLTLRSGGGFLVLFGAPFLLVGLCVIAVSLGVVPVEGEALPPAIGLPFGGIFTAIGAGLMFGRAGTTIDPRRQSLVQWRGILGLEKRSEYFLPDFRDVVLRCETRRSDNGSYTVYPVGLRSVSRQETVILEEPRDYGAARTLAERVARLVDAPLEDSSSGETVRRSASDLDLSLRDSVRRSGGRVEVPPPPSHMRARVTTRGSEVAIEIPASGIRAGHKIVLACLFAGLFFEGPFLYFFFIRGAGFGGTPLPFVIFASIMVVVPVVGFGSFILSSARKRVLIQASPAGLRVEERAPLRSKISEIPGHELEELSYCDLATRLQGASQAQASPVTHASTGAPQPAAFPPWAGSLLASLGRGNRIIARSDRTSLSFACGLSKPETEYLVALLERALVD